MIEGEKTGTFKVVLVRNGGLQFCTCVYKADVKLDTTQSRFLLSDGNKPLVFGFVQ